MCILFFIAVVDDWVEVALVWIDEKLLECSSSPCAAQSSRGYIRRWPLSLFFFCYFAKWEFFAETSVVHLSCCLFPRSFKECSKSEREIPQKVNLRSVAIHFLWRRNRIKAVFSLELSLCQKTTQRNACQRVWRSATQRHRLHLINGLVWYRPCTLGVVPDSLTPSHRLWHVSPQL